MSPSNRAAPIGSVADSGLNTPSLSAFSTALFVTAQRRAANPSARPKATLAEWGAYEVRLDHRVAEIDLAAVGLADRGVLVRLVSRRIA